MTTKVLLEAHLFEIFSTVEIRHNSPSAVKDFMQVIVILLHRVLSDCHVMKNSTKLSLDPLVISVNFPMEAEEKFSISHHMWSSGLRKLL